MTRRILQSVSDIEGLPTLTLDASRFVFLTTWKS